MQKKTLRWIGGATALGAVALLSYFFVFSHAFDRAITPTASLSIAETRINVALSDTPHEREQGLSGTSALSEGEGMLFVFDRDDQHSFWMKDMRYAIDIIWISDTKRVVYIEKDISPDTFPSSFTPPTPARYVLEVPAGFSDRYGVVLGSKVEF